MAANDHLFTADLHCDTVHRLLQGMVFSQRNRFGHIDLPRLLEGGIDLQVFACFVEHTVPPHDRAAQVHRMLDALDEMVVANSGTLAFARSSADLARNRQEGKISVVTAIENGLAIENSLDTLRRFYDRGVRMLTLAHNTSSDWCISSADTSPAFDGLTDFGRDVVRTMDELGMIVDLSHVGPSGVTAVLQVSRKPVVASHSCVHALCAHQRNLSDDQIKAIAGTGGMIGINFLGDFLSPAWRDASEAFIKVHYETGKQWWMLFVDECTAEEFAARRAVLQPFLDAWERQLRSIGLDVGAVADHIDYIVQLVGADHVGLGSDFDGITFAPNGLEDCSRMPRVSEELQRRRYGRLDLSKIMGDNFLRVFREVCG